MSHDPLRTGPGVRRVPGGLRVDCACCTTVDPFPVSPSDAISPSDCYRLAFEFWQSTGWARHPSGHWLCPDCPGHLDDLLA